MLICAAIAGFGLVIVITGLAGLVLLYTGGAVALGAFRSWRPAPERKRHRQLIARLTPRQGSPQVFAVVSPGSSGTHPG